MGSGAPSIDRDAILQKLAERLPASTGGIERLCREHSDLPSPRTIWNWIHEDATFAAAIARLKEEQADALVYGGLEVLQQAEPIDATGVSLAKAEADYRLKMVPKIAPRTMGDRQAVELSGDPDKPLGVGVAAQVELTPEARRAIRKAAREALSESDE